MLRGEPEIVKVVLKDKDFRNGRRVIDQDSGIEVKRKMSSSKAASLEMSVLFKVINKQTPMPPTVADILKYEKWLWGDNTIKRLGNCSVKHWKNLTKY